MERLYISVRACVLTYFFCWKLLRIRKKSMALQAKKFNIEISTNPTNQPDKIKRKCIIEWQPNKNVQSIDWWLIKDWNSITMTTTKICFNSFVNYQLNFSDKTSFPFSIPLQSMGLINGKRIISKLIFVSNLNWHII